MKLFLLLTFLVQTTHSFACMNVTGLNIFGNKTEYHEPFNFSLKIHLDDYQKKMKEEEIRLYKEFGNNTSVEFKNRMGALKIYQGKYREAVELLKSGLISDSLAYSLNSNLGVAYELLGKIDSAYYYTKKAVEINPKSHHGSEWIHLKILEATMHMQRDPQWIYTHSVIGHPIGQDSFPNKVRSASSGNRSIIDLIHQIEYQLGERLLFVKPQSPVVANLILSLADLYITEIDIQHAKPVYDIVKQYDPKLNVLCNKRIALIDQVLNKSRTPGITSDNKKIIEGKILKDTSAPKIIARKSTEKIIRSPAETIDEPTSKTSYHWLGYISFISVLLTLGIFILVKLKYGYKIKVTNRENSKEDNGNNS